ncbi:MAG TPA: hypothetical protein DCZ10_14200 [Pelotomaculum sp.]|nr:hypothetical protein [Pelotomaculum sp.]
MFVYNILFRVQKSVKTECSLSLVEFGFVTICKKSRVTGKAVRPQQKLAARSGQPFTSGYIWG